MTEPTAEQLLVHFDMDEADYLDVKASVAADVEDFMAKVLPKLDPYLRTGIDMGAGAAGATPAGPVVGLVVGLVANAGLSIVEKWLAAKAASHQVPPAPPA